MKVLRAIGIVALLAVAVCAGYWYFSRLQQSGVGGQVAAYYTKPDGETLAKWSVSLTPKQAQDPAFTAFYAAVQTVAGPPPERPAVRFPAGTIVKTVHVADGTATVDLGGNVASSAGGSFTESGEFKALVWTLTSQSGVERVQVEIDGTRVATLPGGHLELDEPLTRKDF